MVEDALSGAIDLIITKSVSRFARNTVDSLTTIRKLKENRVECYFEKENIWTFDGKGELLLTIMSSLAQEESRSISENCTLSSVWQRTPAPPLTRRSTRRNISAWRSGLTGRRSGSRKPAGPSRSGSQSVRGPGGLFPGWKNWTARSQYSVRMTGTALWSMPRCTAKRISVLLSRTGWK